MKNKGYSIITAFGCKTGCSYCIWKQAHSNEKLHGKNWLNSVKAFLKIASSKVSISGGGDPLNNWEKYQNFWNLVFNSGKLIDIHTSYTNWDFLPFEKIHRMVFHSNFEENYKEILKYKNKVKLRVNFVIEPESNIEILKKAEKNLQDIQLSYREYVGSKSVDKNILKFCKAVQDRKENGKWIQQADYNIYLFPDGSIRETYL